MNIYEGLDVGGPAFFRNIVNLSGPITLTPLSSAPTPIAGMIYFNSVDLQFYGCKDGVTWSIIG